MGVMNMTYIKVSEYFPSAFKKKILKPSLRVNQIHVFVQHIIPLMHAFVKLKKKLAFQLSGHNALFRV